MAAPDKPALRLSEGVAAGCSEACWCWLRDRVDLVSLSVSLGGALELTRYEKRESYLCENSSLLCECGVRDDRSCLTAVTRTGHFLSIFFT